MKTLRLLFLAIPFSFSGSSSAWAMKENNPVAKGLCEGYLMKPGMAQLKATMVPFEIRENVSREAFLVKFETLVREAQARGNQLVMFPELFVLDLIQHPSAIGFEAQLEVIADEFTPRLFERAKQLSQELSVVIVAGSSPRRLQDRGIVNTSQVSFPDGRTILQDKLFLTPDEKDWQWKTGSKLNVFQSPWGKMALLICYDSEFPKISQLLGKELPEIILIPSMTGGESGANRVNWSARQHAIAHHAYVLNVGVTGRSGPDLFYAQASLMTPQDTGFPTQVESSLPNVSAPFDVTLNLNQLRESRQRTGIFPSRDTNERRDEITVDSH